MKKICLYLFASIALLGGCVPTFDEAGERPDDPSIKEILAGNSAGKLPQENAIDFTAHVDTVWIKDKTADFANVYLQANLEAGCTVKPLENAPEFGRYGDFSVPRSYRVTAPSGRYTDWTIVLDYYVPQVGCLADHWDGELTCTDEVYPDYSPALCLGEKKDEDCARLEINFDFWADAEAEVTLDLELGEISPDDFTGSVTLLGDVAFSSYGSDMTFHAGNAGTYNALSNELHLELQFSGYDIGGNIYTFTIGL